MNTQEISEQIEALSQSIVELGTNGTAEIVEAIDPEYEAVISGLIMGLQLAKSAIDEEFEIDASEKAAKGHVMAACMIHVVAKVAADNAVKKERPDD